MVERILIVDDDPVQRRLLENMVARVRLRAPSSPKAATPRPRCSPAPTAPRIDAVVLDLVMPDLDGLGVLARMREAGLTMPVIVQTAHGGIDNVVIGDARGRHRFRGQAGRRRAAAGVAAQRARHQARSKAKSSASSAATPAR